MDAVVLRKAHPFAEGDDDENKEVIIAKVTAMIVLFSASTIAGLIPFKLAKVYNWGDKDASPGASKTVALLLSFGGGILLSTTFCHLLPDVEHSIEILVEAGSLPDLPFPLGPTLLCAGFFMIFFIEEMVHWYLHHREDKLLKETLAEHAYERGRSGRNSILLTKKDDEQPLESDKVESTLKKLEDMREHHEKFHHDPEMPHTHIPHVADSEEDSFAAAMRGLMIVLALSIHEFFEGLAVGLEQTAGTVWYMFAAVSAHKYVIAFCIGVELVVNKTQTWLGITYILIYSIVSALGIGLGTLLVNVIEGDSVETMAALLQGLAAGTLLYVVFFEILCKEKSGLPQFCAVLVGFIFIFVIGAFME